MTVRQKATSISLCYYLSMPHAAHHKHATHLKRHKGSLLLNRAVLVMAIMEPLMTLPQVYEIWIRHEAAGVSMATWAFFITAAFVWLLYGLQMKNVPIIVSSTLWMLVEGCIVIGLIVY